MVDRSILLVEKSFCEGISILANQRRFSACSGRYVLCCLRRTSIRSAGACCWRFAWFCHINRGLASFCWFGLLPLRRFLGYRLEQPATRSGREAAEGVVVGIELRDWRIVGWEWGVAGRCSERTSGKMARLSSVVRKDVFLGDDYTSSTRLPRSASAFQVSGGERRASFARAQAALAHLRHHRF